MTRRSWTAVVSYLAALVVAAHARPARGQDAPAAAADPVHGPESAALMRLRGAEPAPPAPPVTVADAARASGAAVPAGLDAGLAATLQMPALPLRMNSHVLEMLARFRSDRATQRMFAGWLRRAGRYRTRMQQVLSEESVPADLIWVAAAESGFNPNSVSYVGAVGLWQLMPETARSYGLRVDAWVDERRDPERSTRAAARMLWDLHERFGTWELALAAYNMGYGALLRALRRFNTNDFASLVALEGGLPFETATYVPRILAMTVGAHNTTPLGYDHLLIDEAVDWDDVPMDRSTRLDDCARELGIDTALIQTLNPSLRGSRTPPVGPSDQPFVLHLPLGTRAAAEAWLARARGPVDPVHVLRVGETVDSVARAHGVQTADLLAFSGLPADVHLGVGDPVLLPEHRTHTPRAQERPLVVTESAGPPPDGTRRGFYRVVAGDTPDSVAAALDVTRATLLRWNRLDADARLHPGLWLQVYLASFPAHVRIWDPADVDVVERGSEAFYDRMAATSGQTRLRVVARAGETLRSIARRYGVTPGSLARLNHRSRDGSIHDGETIIVYARPDSNDSHAETLPSAGAGETVPSAPAPGGGERPAETDRETVTPPARDAPELRPHEDPVDPSHVASNHAVVRGRACAVVSRVEHGALHPCAAASDRRARERATAGSREARSLTRRTEASAGPARPAPRSVEAGSRHRSSHARADTRRPADQRATSRPIRATRDDSASGRAYRHHRVSAR